MTPSVPTRLDRIRAKIERAKHHVRDLESRINVFRQTDPYRVICDKDAQTGCRVFKFQIRAQPPIDLPIIIGEAIHQLRSSLDHLAWQLVEANGNAPGKWTYFPICETAAKYAADSPGKVKGMSAGAKSLIDALKPYQGGNGDFWTLHKLDNIDKHCLLFVVAYGLRQFGFHYTHPAFQNPAGRAWLESLFPDASIPRHGLTVTPSSMFPMFQDGAEIARFSGVPDPQDGENLDVAFEIAFGKPEIVKGQPVLPFLHQLANLVDGVVSQFIPFL